MLARLCNTAMIDIQPRRMHPLGNHVIVLPLGITSSEESTGRIFECHGKLTIRLICTKRYRCDFCQTKIKNIELLRLGFRVDVFKGTLRHGKFLVRSDEIE